MCIYDPFLFLIGNRGAIERVAGSWWSILVGALLIITAGIARNYDHLALSKDFEWFYGPFLASILSSLFIFVIGCGSLIFVKGSKLSYLSFLSLYWMTAPCAWIYGIPVERFTDILTATKWNVTFLAIVSLWRVALMTRSLQVLIGEPVGKCASRIIFPASLIMMVASFLKGIELVGIMGGVRLSPHEEFLRNAANFTTTISFWAAIFSFITLIDYLVKKEHPPKRPLPWKSIPAPRNVIAIVCVLIFIAVGTTIPLQIKTHRNATLDEYIRSSLYRQAIDYASQFEREDFLVDHHFPPGPKYPRNTINLLAHAKADDPTWLIETWIDDLQLDPDDDYLNSYYMGIIHDKDNPDYSPYSEILWKRISERYQLPKDLEPETENNDPFAN